MARIEAIRPIHGILANFVHRALWFPDDNSPTLSAREQWNVYHCLVLGVFGVTSKDRCKVHRSELRTLQIRTCPASIGTV
ncbi:hypothetical protein ZHAS_00008617 [Anopheles sinensis]|uniref:Uncharacterized protein n=1 Tax=Anopheles sinensis TaxID=74873 RepID=A0A084VSQ9_ANOSI|nr:hypothetical protein ZHAS_00008617 [Anopheles sinensis]